MTTDNMSTSTIISDLRKQAKLTQRQMAERYQIPYRTLQQWEQNKRIPPDYVVAMLQRLMAIDFGVKPESTAPADEPHRPTTFFYMDGTPLSMVDEMLVRTEGKDNKLEIVDTDITDNTIIYRCTTGLTFKVKRKE